MAARKLGGGRVLGSGRSLSPAVPLQLQKHPGLPSPSPSSLSVSSQASRSQLTVEDEDLGSRVSLDNGESAAAGVAAASSKLVCPICNEGMVTLLQLNRHLDDDHQNLEEVKQNEAKDWFKTQMVKAKRFQPLAVLNQKLKGLEVFESNDALPAPTASVPTGHQLTAETSRSDPDELVTRQHWQRSGANDACSEPMCGKRLTAISGSVNCRKCGRLFCEEHTMYQMKLSRSAQHEPVRGYWCRVCETCYKSREGYNDPNGFERDHTEEFFRTRRKNVDRLVLEVSRLEKRLTKLTQLLTHPSAEINAGGGGLLWPLSSVKNQRKLLEQSVVTWEEDATVSNCPFCQQEFSNYSFRRHHCRLCGRVVCGDFSTGCSSEVGLNVAAATDYLSEKALGQTSVDVRMCKDCKHTIFSRADFAHELAQKPPDLRAYETLVQFERGIRLLLPNFQRLLTALQDPDTPPTSAQITNASKVRKRLLDSFAKYDSAARRIRDLPTTSPTQQRLQKAIYGQATNFLHLHMLPLKTLPKILKHASPHGNSAAANGHHLHLDRPPNGTTSALAAINYKGPGSATAASSSSALSTLESEEKELRERLIVLEEQKFFVGEMVADANKRRRFDEVAALKGNLEDLGREINGVVGKLGALDFEGAYGNGG
ncbi:MAG: carboxypeptidase Y-deficient [Candelina submexicana]|nr:MAG: carboxypeptidase Y-deficient [Candelina submexicana]